MVVGLDLGTTNSLLCYFIPDKEIKSTELKYLHFGIEKRDFFPSVVAYPKSGGAEYLVGSAASNLLGSKNYHIYEHFKLGLGKGADVPDKNGMSPRMVACDFLREILRQLQLEYPGEEIKSIVITIPDVWKNEPEYKIAVDNLVWVFEELNFPAAIAFESEPVSAAVYYCCEVEERFRGHLLVVDYGGGTLDLTLCCTEDGSSSEGNGRGKDGRVIRVLQRCGDLGHAGSAFDEEMVRYLYQKYGSDPNYELHQEDYKPGTKRYYRFRNAFESSKIGAADKTRKVLKDYYSFGGFDAKMFDVPSDEDDDYPVYASDMATVFDRVNKNVLTNAIDFMLEYCRSENIDINHMEHFRILMVGGFSSLYCVENVLRERFGANAAVRDIRIDTPMPLSSRITAIASGAALLASKFVNVVYLCPSSYGFYYYSIKDMKMVPLVVIERGKPEQEFREPKYTAPFRLFSASFDTMLRLFFDDGKGIVPFTMDETFLKLCPNANDPDNNYQIGFSIGSHHIPMLHIRDKNGEVKVHSLNRILDQIAIIPAEPYGGV